MTVRDSFSQVSDGDQLDDGYFNGVVGECMSMALNNHVRTLINRAGVYSGDTNDLWGEAYVDANGRSNSVDTDLTLATFDANKYKVPEEETIYVTIEATSLTESDFAINDCLCRPFASDSGKWVLYCTTGTDAVKRAQIYSTLFYGSNGTDARVTDTYITGLTVLSSSISADVGKRFHYATATGHGSDNGGTGTIDYTGTFVDTSTDTDVDSWSNCYTCPDSNGSDSWQMPSGTTLNSAAYNTANSLEIGTDTSADNIDNPATCNLYGHGSNYSQSYGITRTVIICKTTLTWVDDSTTDGNGYTSCSNIDFTADESVPLLTLAEAFPATIVTHDIPTGTFNSTVSSAIGSPLVEDWETGAAITYKLTNATEDTGWLTTNTISEFTVFTSEPTSLIVKLTPKSSNPTDSYPSIRGFGVRAT